MTGSLWQPVPHGEAAADGPQVNLESSNEILAPQSVLELTTHGLTAGDNLIVIQQSTLKRFVF
jgi:hypothetical protein